MKDQMVLIQELLARIDQLEKENALLKEQNAYLMKKLYGQESETSASVGISADEKSLCLAESHTAKSDINAKRNSNKKVRG
jgi:hypothetical protein